MKRFRVRYSRRAHRDLDRLTEFLTERDPEAAAEAEQTIRQATSTLERLPFVGRPALGQSDLTLRELIVPFSSTGYVVLYRVGPGSLVSVLSVRHQREETYH